MSQTISLCMIVRNEVSNLPECLGGLQSLFHQIVVVDTGSVDRTREIASSLGAEVFEHPWTDDFSAARNASRAHATGDWVMWLDADDRIDDGNVLRLRTLFGQLHRYSPDQNPVFLMDCVSKVSSGAESAEHTIAQARLFPREARIAWRGRIHESFQPLDPGSQIVAHPTDIKIRHTGYADPEVWARKQIRDQRMLEREFLIDPDNALTLYYLARQYMTLGRTEDSIRFARRSIAADPNRAFISTMNAFDLLSAALMRQRRFSEALSTTEDGLASFPRHAGLLLRKGQLLYQAGHFREAMQSARQAMLGGQTEHSLAGKSAAVDEATALLVVDCHVRLGQFEDARQTAELLLRAKPQSMRAWLAMGQIGLALQRNELVHGAIAGLGGVSGSDAEQAVLKARLCLRDKRLADARRWAERAMASNPASSAAWTALADVLYYEDRDLDHCINVHRKALALDPACHVLKARLDALERRHRTAPAASPFQRPVVGPVYAA